MACNELINSLVISLPGTSRVRPIAVVKNPDGISSFKTRSRVKKKKSLGQINVKKSGAFTFRPKSGKKGKVTWTYEVTDNEGLTGKEKVVITVK